jgi:hypothetical protein
VNRKQNGHQRHPWKRKVKGGSPVVISRNDLFLLEPGGCYFESFARVIFLEEHQLLQVPKPRGKEDCRRERQT